MRRESIDLIGEFIDDRRSWIEGEPTLKPVGVAAAVASSNRRNHTEAAAAHRLEVLLVSQAVK